MNDECFLVEKAYYDAARGGAAGEAQYDCLREIAAFNRINAMAAVAAARHGWIGACFSAAEIITALYFDIAETGGGDPRRDAVVLGKGHAAAMQYAALAGLGRIPVAALLQYKQPGGPQAHADMTTPGIDTNTGSLGQALSKCCGLAMTGRRRVFAVLGDGELQEGQNYEALMTAVHYGLDNLTVIVDRNGLQSDSTVADVMGIGDPAAVFRAFGMNTVEVDGNDMAALHRAVAGAAAAGVPTAVIAHTVKGRGVGFMESRDARRRAYAWHGRPPAGDEYHDALAELGGSLRNRELAEEIASFVSARRGRPPAPPRPRRPGMSTGAAFARRLVDVAMDRPAIRVLDADLEKPCRLDDFARRLPGRFLEMGICEQDMVSCAGGLALGGEIPVVNTYAAFFRRAFEQVYVNATEQTRILYAGHYAGLCYTTDGRTHQCTGDIGMMRSIPGMAVLDQREDLPSRPRIVHRAVRGMTGCTRDPEGLYRRFGLTADAVAAFINETQ